MKRGNDMDYLKNSPYGPSHKEIKEEKNHEKKQKEQTNVLLEEILVELKKLSAK
jgi:hypothetical protein